MYLFDFKATHSFIFLSHAKALNHEIEPLENRLLISTPSGEVFLVKLVCRDHKVKIENVTMKINLILFKLDELDVILGMDFLTKYHVVLDCSNKEVVLRDLGRFEMKFIGHKKVKLAGIIYVLKVEKLVRKRHNAYLARVMDT